MSFMARNPRKVKNKPACLSLILLLLLCLWQQLGNKRYPAYLTQSNTCMNVVRRPMSPQCLFLLMLRCSFALCVVLKELNCRVCEVSSIILGILLIWWLGSAVVMRTQKTASVNLLKYWHTDEFLIWRCCFISCCCFLNVHACFLLLVTSCHAEITFLFLMKCCERKTIYDYGYNTGLNWNMILVCRTCRLILLDKVRCSITA